MPNHLCSIERIYTHIEEGQFYIALLKVTTEKELEGREVVLNSCQLKLKNIWRVNEGWYVYYNEGDKIRHSSMETNLPVKVYCESVKSASAKEQAGARATNCLRTCESYKK